jgi:hypothetical protein
LATAQPPVATGFRKDLDERLNALGKFAGCGALPHPLRPIGRTVAAIGGPSNGQEKNASGAAVMARPVAVDGMGEENTSTQKTENHSYSLEHRRRPWPSHLT